MRAARLARVLWFAWAVVVWCVMFDRAIVVAGRAYVAAAEVAARTGGTYLRIEDWMRPAAVRAFWTATLAAAILLVVGLIAVKKASPSNPSYIKR